MKRTDMIDGTEWCPYCEGEQDFNVDEKTWIVPCKTCGRPLLLCDKCHTLGQDKKCGSCKHEKELAKAVKKWEKEQVGRIVYWNDPDGEICSGYCVVVGFNEDGAYVLEHIVISEKKGYSRGGTVETFGGELDFPSEEEQIEYLMKMFNAEAKWSA